jgi:hypothetical protein
MFRLTDAFCHTLGPEAWAGCRAPLCPAGLSYFLWRRVHGHAGKCLTPHRHAVEVVALPGGGT